MSSANSAKLPRILIEQLFEADHASQGKPSLPAEQRSIATAWLSRILIDFEALKQHIALLQELYDSPFRYARPRRDRWNVDQPLVPDAASKFPHSKFLSDDHVKAVLDQGVESLSAEDMASLLLNPYAIYELFDIIDDVQPDLWLQAYQDLATMILAPNVKTTRTQDTPSPYTEKLLAPISSKSVPGNEFWRQLPEQIAAALAKSGSAARIAEPASTSHQPANFRGRWSYGSAAATVAACCLSVAAFWVALQASNNDRAALAKLTAMTENGQGTTGPSNAIELQSAPGAAMSLKQLKVHGYLRLETDNDEQAKQLKEIRAAATPEIRALITAWLENKREPGKIVADLRSLLDQEPKAAP